MLQYSHTRSSLVMTALILWNLVQGFSLLLTDCEQRWRRCRKWNCRGNGLSDLGLCESWWSCHCHMCLSADVIQTHHVQQRHLLKFDENWGFYTYILYNFIFCISIRWIKSNRLQLLDGFLDESGWMGSICLQIPTSAFTEFSTRFTSGQLRLCNLLPVEVVVCLAPHCHCPVGIELVCSPFKVFPTFTETQFIFPFKARNKVMI